MLQRLNNLFFQVLVLLSFLLNISNIYADDLYNIKKLSEESKNRIELLNLELDKCSNNLQECPKINFKIASIYYNEGFFAQASNYYKNQLDRIFELTETEQLELYVNFFDFEADREFNINTDNYEWNSNDAVDAAYIHGERFINLAKKNDKGNSLITAKALFLNFLLQIINKPGESSIEVVDALNESLDYTKKMRLKKNDLFFLELQAYWIFHSDRCVNSSDICREKWGDEIYSFEEKIEVKNLMRQASYNTTDREFIMLYLALVRDLIYDIKDFKNRKFYFDDLINEIKFYEEKNIFFEDESSEGLYYEIQYNICVYHNDLKCKISTLKKQIELSNKYLDEVVNYHKILSNRSFLIEILIDEGLNYEANKQYPLYLEDLENALNNYNFLNFNQKKDLVEREYKYDLMDIINSVLVIDNEMASVIDYGIEFEFNTDWVYDGPSKSVSYYVEDEELLIPYGPFSAPDIVRVKSVKPGSSAEKASIEVGDLIIRYQGWSLDSMFFSDIHIQDNFDKWLVTKMGQNFENELLIMKSRDFENYFKTNEDVVLKPVTLRSKEPIEFSEELIDYNLNENKRIKFLDSAFKASQLLLTTKASNSFMKLLERSNNSNEQYDLVIKQIHEQEEYLLLEEQRIEASGTSSKLENIELKFNLKKNISDLRKSISKSNSEFQRLFSLKDVQDSLKDDELLVIYLSESPFFVFKWIITNDHASLIRQLVLSDYPIFYDVYASEFFSLYDDKQVIEHVRMNIDDIRFERPILSRDEIEKIELKYENGFSYKVRNWVKHVMDQQYGRNFLQYKSAAHYISMRVMTSVANEDFFGKKLIFLFNDDMSSIPINILPIPITADRYIIDEFAVSNIVSLSSLFNRINESNKKKKTFLGIGNPKFGNKVSQQTLLDDSFFNSIVKNLFRNSVADRSSISSLPSLPETENELKNISLLFEDSRLLLGENASETNIKKMNLKNYKVINFASHSIPASKNSKYSEAGIVLSLPEFSNEEDDGILTASEILKLDLDADIVVLSACNTALSDQSKDEVLSGLAYAFLHAGAKVVLASHWDVQSEATTILMSEFFKFWMDENYELPVAFQKAQLSLKNREKYAHPTYWGAFSIYGL